jgi:hypothetical protein
MSGVVNMIEMCSVRSIPKRDSVMAALQERPDNLLQDSELKDADVQQAQSTIQNKLPAPAMALAIKKLWKPGRTIRIAFLGSPHPVVQEKIINYAQEWLSYANLVFEFVEGSEGDIRISTTSGEGSWSYVGTDALTIHASEATMNFGWLTPHTDDEECRKVVLHEFGHALGAEHEHQHPYAGIPWNREKVYQYYKESNDWDEEVTDINIFAKYSITQINTTGYDPTSIMHYPIDGELTDNKLTAPWNYELSAKDNDLMLKCYPVV